MTQTCSVLCSKRHKQRASCNGQRDPAAYKKRSEWATPSGIDQDYNYLKSVERHVDRTGDDVRERGINTGHRGRGGERGAAGNKKVSKSWVPGSALQKYLSGNDIRVEKAPNGMSRQKANLTRVTHKGNVMWTVEWLDKDGRKTVDNENSEDLQVRELWGEVVAKRLNIEQGKKRKRESEKQTAPQKLQTEEGKQDASTDINEGIPRPGSAAPATSSQSSTTNLGTTSEQSNQAEEETPLQETSGAPEKDHQQPEKLLEHPDSATQEHFYLRKPFTACKSIVLIPIDASNTLTKCLKGQTVLEFPTVHILPEAPDSLPAGYMLEEQYNELQKAEEAEVNHLMQKTNQSTGGALSAVKDEEKPLDANSILDMLKRDVGV